MTESHVDAAVQARIAAAKVRVQAAKQRRDDLAQARKRGLAHRHARKLKNLADAERRAAEQHQDGEVLSRSRNNPSGQGGEPEEAP